MEFLKIFKKGEGDVKSSCDKCDALCCVHPQIDESELQKPADEPCEHLDCDSKICKLHPEQHIITSFFGDDARPDVCGKYDCGGVGEIVTKLFEGHDMNMGDNMVVRGAVFHALYVSNVFKQNIKDILSVDAYYKNKVFLDDVLKEIDNRQDVFLNNIRKHIKTGKYEISGADANDIIIMSLHYRRSFYEYKEYVLKYIGYVVE